jgi:hypothetical protein
MELNVLVVLMAAVVGFAIGAFWFGPRTFYPIWWKLMGKSPDVEPGSSNMFAVFGLSALASLVQAAVLWLLLTSIDQASGPMGWFGGLAVGSLVGVGFAAATSISHRLFAGAGLRVWMLEVGQDIVSLAAMGAIIGVFI